MIELLTYQHGLIEPQASTFELSAEFTEAHLVEQIYRFASQQEEWFNLLLGLSQCISTLYALPEQHPYKDVAERLLAHFRNAIKISTRLNQGASPQYSEDGTLDLIPMPVGIIDQHTKVVALNEQAEQAIDQSTEWTQANGYLWVRHFNLQQELVKLTNSGTNFSSLPVSDPSGHINKLHITQIPRQSGTQADCLFYICFQTGSTVLVNQALLQHSYQLTDMETLVVAAIVREISTDKAALALKLKPATVRDHLSNIYLKFEVRRKPELIRKVMLHSLLKIADNSASNPQLSRRVANSDSKTAYIYLRDGRKMSYVDHRPPGASANPLPTVLLMHNLMGSAFELPPGGEQVIAAHHIRLIVPERPGYGDSDPHDKHNHSEWCHDIEALLDALRIDSVKVIGHSIGGAYALAIAAILPQRVERVALVSSIPRVSDIRQATKIPLLLNAIMQCNRFAPFLLEPIFKMAVGNDLEKFYQQQLNFVRPKALGRDADLKLLNTPEFKQYCLKNIKQSLKQGSSVWAEALKLSFSKWSFHALNKHIPHQIWHGHYDDVVPLPMAESLAQDLNVQSFNRIGDETHFLFSRHFAAIVDQLVRNC